MFDLLLTIAQAAAPSSGMGMQEYTLLGILGTALGWWVRHEQKSRKNGNGTSKETDKANEQTAAMYMVQMRGREPAKAMIHEIALDQATLETRDHAKKTAANTDRNADEQMMARRCSQANLKQTSNLLKFLAKQNGGGSADVSDAEIEKLMNAKTGMFKAMTEDR